MIADLRIISQHRLNGIRDKNFTCSFKFSIRTMADLQHEGGGASFTDMPT